MSFFSKLKQFIGLNTLDVKLNVDPHFRATDSAISGTLHITAKSDQSVLKIVLEVLEKFESGRGDDKKEQQYSLGTVRLAETFFIKANDSKDIPFSVPFQLKKSSNDELKERGGMFGTIGKMGAWAANEKSEYSLRAVVDVQGTSLDPTDTVPLKLLK